MFKKILALVVMLYATLAMAAVDVNKANDAQLDSVKGIGPATSKQILDERKKGEFKSWEDFISRVKGIAETKAAKLSEEGLTVNGQSYKPAATKKEATAKDEKKNAKAEAKEDKKDTKAETKAEKKDAKATAKEDKKDAKADAASAKK